MRNPDTLMPQKQASSFYLWLVFLIMASSSIVLIEPAPVDFGLIFLLVAGILFQRLRFSYANLTPALLFLYLFVVASLISMFELPHTLLGVRDFAITFYLILSWFLYIGIIEMYGQKAVKILFYGYTLAAVFSAAIGILTFFGIIPWQEILMKFSRVKGLFKDPNVFGPFLIPIALYAYSLIEQPKGKQKVIWPAILAILIFGIFLSFSRAAWGNMVLSLFLYTGLRFLLEPSMKVIGKFLLTLVLLFGIFNYVLSIPLVNEMFYERFEYQYYDDDRFSNQATAVGVGASNPLGIGPGQYEETIGYATHNSFLRVLSENGLVGFIGYTGFLLTTLYRSLRIVLVTKSPLSIVIFASAVGLLFNGIVVDTLHWRHFWFIYALPWAFPLPKK
ncbi:O-antigen ligase family protein [Planococcus citreus]|uniref:O-antigen ligase-related domain-containing protein n=1 Tax=Planococcus citreus TaxID=1373 RepID=A0A497YQI9_9BACL|nr:O-antigen ligase family protein [Planococcus citreus]RLJ90593.1 hypothetical protein DFR62_0737 [Planococcus citreus]